MIRIFLVGLLLTFAATQTTINYAFSGNPSGTQVVPTFSLGVLTATDNITFAFQSAAGKASGFTVKLLDSTRTELTTQPVTFTGTFPETVQWQVATTGTYYIRISQVLIPQCNYKLCDYN